MAATKTCGVRFYARNRDGSIKRASSGRLATRIERVAVIDQIGAWAIVPAGDSRESAATSRDYTVAHVPTGYVVTWMGMGLREAKQLLGALAAMPNQAAWRRIKNKGWLSRAMRDEGAAVVRRALGRA